MTYHVYILCSRRNGTLYVGVTSHLPRRMYEHKNKILKGFTNKYKVDKLVHVESYEEVREAIFREKCFKKWKRTWKIRLIENNNPNWNDLSVNLF